jgi:hypothetical protein
MKRIKLAFKAFCNVLTSTEIDSKPFRRVLSVFYNNREYGSNVLGSITDVRVFDKGDYYSLQITTQRPGILIGKAGHFIDEMTAFINDREFDKPVKIDLQECKLWHKLY